MYATPIRIGSWSQPPANRNKPVLGGKTFLGPAFTLALLGLLAVGCGVEVAPDALHLKQASFKEMPGWETSDPADGLLAFQRSCTALMPKADNEPMGSYAGSVGDWRSACEAGAKTNPAEARAFFEATFTPVQILVGDKAEGRFTGYYEPQIAGSHTKHDDYQIPVYGRPSDLITVDLSAFRPALASEKIAGKVDGTKLVPYATRAEISAKGLPTAPVLFYARDPVALFFLHIQGSGRVLFDDGSKARVAYAAQNGQPYTAIGKTLIARGVPREGMSMQVIRAWLKSHPEEADAVINSDASYVFFALQPLGDAELGAKGAQGVPLTPMSSLAVDMRLHAWGTPFFVTGSAPLGHLFVAQDTGGAIRGPIRGDVYFGFGEKAEDGAGTQNQMGSFYALLPKAVVTRLAAKGMKP
jgi:membrane-bound lytic murein transglycosylase A